MISDGKMFELLDERHKEYERIKNEYPPMSPFVSGVERASNIRMNNPLCPTWPYEQH